MAPKAIRTPLVRLFLASILFMSLGSPEAVAAPLRTAPFWACSDGKGTVTLFWLPPDGQWPSGGFRLERIVRKQRVLLAKALGPGLDGEALGALPPGDAEGIQALSGKIRGGTLTEEERRHSISVMGKTAATDIAYGRALGVRYTDRVRGGGKLLYRLTPLDSEGKPGDPMESNEVDSLKRTPGPAQPSGLAAEENPGAVALAWSDPPASVLAPVVAFRVERITGRGKAQSLTPTPLVLNRHLTPGRPDFLDADPPREQLVYRVRSIDIFGRMSAPTRVAISAKSLPPVSGPTPALSPAAMTSDRTGSSAPSAADRAREEKPIREQRTASASPPVRESAVLKEPKRESVKAEQNPVPETARAAASAVPVTEKPAPAVPASESGPAPPVETPGEKANPMPDRGPRSMQVGTVKEETVSAAGLSGGGSSPREEPARAESYPVVRRVPKPAPAEGDTGEPPAKPSAEIRPRKESDARRTAAAARREAGPPPPPTIVTIAGLGDKVSITFRPGDPQDLSSQFLVYRSESPMGPGVVVGRPVPGDARQWEDPTVEAGQYFWYRIVAVDEGGNRSPPSKPKWVAVGSH